VRRRRRTDAPVRCSASVETWGGGKATAEGLIESGTALIGSPKTVLAGIERMRERTGFGILVALLQFGILSDALTRRNMDLFAAEVMPHLRD
jgi:alkanesulfonate monooxygenase SsuD/methylene tetrahydromethanopterin reductase-like flavin-dependent oxidoreductase (luciferase family)